jgi:hypothetical protein
MPRKKAADDHPLRDWNCSYRLLAERRVPELDSY